MEDSQESQEPRTRAEENSPETIQINQEFQLFPIENTTLSERKPKYPGREILLEIDDMPRLPIRVGVIPSRSKKQACITPFDPELGYRITKEDFTLKERRTKYQQNSSELEQYQYIDEKVAPLGLMIMASEYKLEEAGIAIKIGVGNHKIPDDIRKILEKLRLQLFTPMGSFAAEPNNATLSLGGLWFNMYYPLDIGGPLPTGDTPEERIRMPEGFLIYLPDDREKLATLYGRFVLPQTDTPSAML